MCFPIYGIFKQGDFGIIAFVFLKTSLTIILFEIGPNDFVQAFLYPFGYDPLHLGNVSDHIQGYLLILQCLCIYTSKVVVATRINRVRVNPKIDSSLNNAAQTSAGVKEQTLTGTALWDGSKTMVAPNC